MKQEARAQGGWRRMGFGGLRAWALLVLWAGTAGPHGQAETRVYLTGVPDYQWHAGCFGTASGNLIGFWDRHGLDDFYRGPTAGGVAPLDGFGANRGILSLWASKAGRDGRPADQPGHEDDYYVDYESTAQDPYVAAGRPAHAADCVGDFIGLNQLRWKNMNGECDGNIDGYTFVYWDASGARRVNYTPGSHAGLPAVDLQSGLRAYAEHCGYQADTFTQLGQFNPELPQGAAGFTFQDLRAEIDAGYPVLVLLQNPAEKSRPLGGLARVNPDIHGMLIYGYYVDDGENAYAIVRTSWATGEEFRPWTGDNWTPTLPVYLPVRGVIGFHPKPQIRAFERKNQQVTVRWVGPGAEVHDRVNGTTWSAHRYVLERATQLAPNAFQPLSQPTTARELTVDDCCETTGFYRLRILPPER